LSTASSVGFQGFRLYRLRCRVTTNWAVCVGAPLSAENRCRTLVVRQELLKNQHNFRLTRAEPHRIY
jgi:hypothetical protein